jgi:hypothetical protein
VYTFGSLGGPHHGLRSRHVSSPAANHITVMNARQVSVNSSPPVHATIRIRGIKPRDRLAWFGLGLRFLLRRNSGPAGDQISLPERGLRGLTYKAI